MTGLRRRLYPAQRLLSRHRRPVAATMAAITMFALVRVLSPPAPPTTSVLVAAHDLREVAGWSAADVKRVGVLRRPDSRGHPHPRSRSRPDGRRTRLGRRDPHPASARRAGSRVRLRARRGRRTGSGQRLRRGRHAQGRRSDHVYAARASGSEALAVVQAAPVAALPVPPADGGGGGGALVVVVVTPTDAARLAQEAARTPLAFALR